MRRSQLRCMAHPGSLDVDGDQFCLRRRQWREVGTQRLLPEPLQSYARTVKSPASLRCIRVARSRKATIDVQQVQFMSSAEYVEHHTGFAKAKHTSRRSTRQKVTALRTSATS